MFKINRAPLKILVRGEIGLLKSNVKWEIDYEMLLNKYKNIEYSNAILWLKERKNNEE